MNQSAVVGDLRQPSTEFMVQLAVSRRWPSEGTLRFEVPGVTGEISVSPDLARRRAKGYLSREVALAFRPGEPVLVWGSRPVWRMTIHLFLRGYGQVAELGVVEVDAISGEVIPLAPAQIAAMQGQANAIARRLTPPTGATG
jgi:hypothetical protein